MVGTKRTGKVAGLYLADKVFRIVQASMVAIVAALPSPTPLRFALSRSDA
jgi:hypothetical protein